MCSEMQGWLSPRHFGRRECSRSEAGDRAADGRDMVDGQSDSHLTSKDDICGLAKHERSRDQIRRQQQDGVLAHERVDMRGVGGQLRPGSEEEVEASGSLDGQMQHKRQRVHFETAELSCFNFRRLVHVVQGQVFPEAESLVTA